MKARSFFYRLQANWFEETGRRKLEIAHSTVSSAPYGSGASILLISYAHIKMPWRCRFKEGN